MSGRALGLNFDGSFVTADESSTLGANSAGMVVSIKTREGLRFFKWMKAEEAFAIGQVAMISAVRDDADVDAVAAIGATTLTGTGDFTANEFNDGTFPSAFASINAGTGIGQTRAISHNRGSANVLSLEENNGWDVALDTTSDYLTYDINYVSLADTDDVSQRASAVMGVAISAVTDEYWSWFQVGGFCPLVRCVGTADATIRGAIIVPSGTAGACRGPTAGGTTADEATNAFGIALVDHASADAAGRGISAILNCRWTNLAHC